MSWVLSLVEAVITLPVVTLAAVWCWYQWTRRRQLAFARKLPTVLPALPLLGHLPYMMNNIKMKRGRMEDLFCGHSVKGISCVWVGPVPWILVNRAEEIKIILNNSQTLGKAIIYKPMSYYLGVGLVTAPVHLWKISRKHLNPMFSAYNLQSFLPTLNESAVQLVEDLSEHDGGGSFDVEHYLYTFAMTNIMKLAFGPDVQNDDPTEFSLFINAAKRMPEVAATRMTNPVLWLDSIYQFMKKHDWETGQKLISTTKIFNERNRKRKEQSTSELKKEKRIADVINSMSVFHAEFDKDYVVDEMLTFGSTGTDTVAITMSSCLVVLGTHPEIQEKLYQEIIEVIGRSSDHVTLDDINKMTYLDQVLKEVWRRFALVPIIGRRCNKDIELGEHTIPEGSTLIISLAGLHLNHEIHPDPLRFDPDRFSPENVDKRDSYCYLPFSGGPRNCIGKPYAVIQAKTALVHLIKNYKISSDLDINKVTYQFSVFLNFKNGYDISIKKR